MRPCRLALAALLCLSPITLRGQRPPDADSLQRVAADAFGRRDWAAASAGYTRLTQLRPADGTAWVRLGAARHELGDLDGALRALGRARAAGDSSLALQMRLARVHARRNERDLALRALGAALAIGGVTPTYLTKQDDFASLRDDARFASLVARADSAMHPCRSSAEAAQLDFWIGTWDVSVAGNPAGVNEVTPTLEHCVLVERWSGAGGLTGSSMNFWDGSRRRWRQVWVADNGNVLDYTGEFRDGAMRFTGETPRADGTRALHRLTFFPIAKDTVRQLMEDSPDGGKTWATSFDGLYVRRAGAASAASGSATP